MSAQVQISIDADVYGRLMELMVPPVNDANAVIRELLFHDGRDSRASIALAAAEHHFSTDEERQRAMDGVFYSPCS